MSLVDAASRAYRSPPLAGTGGKLQRACPAARPAPCRNPRSEDGGEYILLILNQHGFSTGRVQDKYWAFALMFGAINTRRSGTVQIFISKRFHL